MTNRPTMGHNAEVGLVVAAGVVPSTFSRSLAARTWADQGIITGLATGAHLVLTAGAHTLIESAGSAVATMVPLPKTWSPPERARAATLVLDVAAVPIGLGAARLLETDGRDTTSRAMLRQAAWRLALAGLGGSVLGGARAATRSLDDALGARGWIARFPVSIPVGLATAAVIERVRQHDTPPEHETDPARGNPALGLAAGAGVVLVLGGLAIGEDWLARATGSLSARVLPGTESAIRRLTHVMVLGSVAGGLNALWNRAMVGIETGTTTYEKALDAGSSEEWTTPYVSGHPSSLVSWEGLGREGRRHVSAFVRPTPPAGVPSVLHDLAVPDHSIATVMREEPRATPIEVYVGLDNAPTPRERVDLALAELDRTDAWSRSLLMLVSPTGTGYVNYVAVAAAQYLTRGDIATVTLQYSKRPSPLSLGKISQAREQNRLLWLRVLSRVRQMPPETRPRVVVFGESLGAHTSQAAFTGWGTLGPEALGIDRALWIGTPAGSPWYRELLDQTRLDVDRSRIAIVNDHEQYVALGEAARREVRYVLVNHDNDGVTTFEPGLLLRRPAWLGPDRPAIEEVPGRSPRGVPRSMRWRPVTTFFQSLVDMKNAQIPGAYRAWAHDYRPDLPEFVRDAFDLECSDEQLGRIQAACQDREELRQRILA